MSKPIDRLVSYYALEDETEETGTGQDLTLSGSPSFTTGKISNAIDCDPTGSKHAELANANAGDFQVGNGNKAISVWCRPDSLPASGNGGAIIRMGSGAASQVGWHIVYNNSGGNGQFLFRLADGTTLYSINGPLTATAGSWYHLVFNIFRTGSMEAFVNGVSIGTADISSSSAVNIASSQDVIIGGVHQVHYDGLIDEIALLDETLSHDIINWLYNSGSGRSYSDWGAFDRAWIKGGHGRGFTNAGNVTELQITAPAFVETGDLILIAAGADSISGAQTSPIYRGGTQDGNTAGFTTELSDDSTGPSTALYGKNAVANDVTQSSNLDDYEWVWSSIQGAAGLSLAIGNHDGIHVKSSISSGTSDSTPPSPGLTTTVDKCLILRFLVVDDNAGGSLSLTRPSGTIQVLNEYHATPGSTGGVVIGMALEYKETAGVVGSVDWTIGAGRDYLSWTVAIAPLSTGGDTITLGYTDSANVSYALGTIEVPVTTTLGYTDSGSVSYALSSIEVGATVTLGYTDSANASYALTITGALLLGYTDSAGESYALGTIEVPATVTLGYTDTAGVSYALASLESAVTVTLGYTDSGNVSYALSVTEAATSLSLGFTASGNVSYSLAIEEGSGPETIELGYTVNSSISYAIIIFGDITSPTPFVAADAGRTFIAANANRVFTVS